ncbi:hypothetical protein TWF106_004456 [Orbilia oligospora]|uniref:LYR motif-containing protein 2 n=1 Tax=Orbilia oligospora TaxID=2813651 RepID=A0A6G1LVC9_ORBOL|nr:hypothetical protein TWF788_005526 [Orbilia oligospora]KAF3197876.1 hypothetical protein TWF679_002562 [Orbilia oligospora]KAF3206021.1 hypothetical protein TWF191_001571 [Orbilia oligospora]KAF3224257.1 hypothetical protein TWF106_004456 [Orbilia oligospora]KAF3235712.1 hypothetical protein TWF192_000659 [Orbilia oligospora]
MIVAFRRYASSRSGAKLGLDRWIQRSRVLALWREILRTVRHIEDPATREEMRSWARHEFKRNKNVEEMTQIRYLISVRLPFPQPPLIVDVDNCTDASSAPYTPAFVAELRKPA